MISTSSSAAPVPARTLVLKALLALPQPVLMLKLWRTLVHKGLSVRQTEAEVQSIARRKPKGAKGAGPPVGAAQADRPKSSFLNHAEVELLSALSTKVRVKPRDVDTGTIEITYYSQDDLERILDIIIGRPGSGA